MDFADKVKLVRKQLALSQEKFAVLLGVSFATVNRWEQGKAIPNYRTVQKLIELCRECGIQYEEM